VLGADISEYPDAHPRRLQDPAYIGVASMQVEGRPGYTLVRTPLATDELTAEIAAATAHLTCDPLRLLEGVLSAEPLQLAA
jgi:S-DNA-T family DNA segregation ATPase FtsK/SpoIIIE